MLSGADVPDSVNTRLGSRMRANVQVLALPLETCLLTYGSAVIDGVALKLK